MIAGVESPSLGQGIGYARFNSPDDWAGRVLSFRLPDQTVHECNIVDLPFFDAEKQLSRGLGEVPDGTTSA